MFVCGCLAQVVLSCAGLVIVCSFLTSGCVKPSRLKSGSRACNKTNVLVLRCVGVAVGKRPKGENTARKQLSFIRRLHAHQLQSGGHCHHEQPTSSKEPFDGPTWPWAVGAAAGKVDVAACSVGLAAKNGKRVGKSWTVETTSASLRCVLESCKCTKDHEHQAAAGNITKKTACYTPLFARLVSQALVNYDAV